MAYTVTNNPWSSQYNVGIGIETPCSTLHVFGAGATMRLGPYYSDTDRDYLFFEAGGTNSQIITRNESMTIHNCGGPLILNPSGQCVGIGTTSAPMALTFTDSLGGKILFNNNPNNYSIGLASGVVSADSSMKFMAGCTTPGDFTFYRGSTLSMIITCAGNVGIGPTAPNRLLDVSSGGDTYLRVTGNRGNSDDLHVSNVEFYNSNSTRIIAEIRAITGTGGTQSNSGQLAFYTNDNGTYAERLRIASAGAATFSSTVNATGLFIGTSNGQVADINSTNANGGYLTWSTSGTVIADLGTAQQIFGSGGNDTFGINGRGARALTFGTYNTERLRITSGGNVGISTSSPQSTYKVTISGTDTIFPAIYLENTTNSQAYSIRATGTNFVVRDNTSGNDRFTIASTGAAEFSSTIKTAAPTGYTAKPWKLGDATSGTITPNYYIKVEIDGQIYAIPALQGLP